MGNGSDLLLQRHFANLSHLRDTFRIDPRAQRGAGQISPWLAGFVQPVHPAFPGSFTFTNPQARLFANPAAGADFSITVPPNESWGVRAFRFLLVTDANAGNRTPQVILEDGGGNIFFVVPPISLQAASLARSYQFGRAFGYQAELGAIKVHGLPDLVFAPGMILRSSISNIQVGDQISELTVMMDVFPG